MAAPSIHPAPRWSLLLVDDEQDVLSSVKEVLEWGIPGLEVVTASSGPAGLAVLKGRQFDLIVSDFRMPNMDGIQFLYQCGLTHPRTPRVILTAFSTEFVAQRTSPDAIEACLSKTTGPTVLVDWIRHRLESVPAAAVRTLAKVGLPASGHVAVNRRK